MSQESKPYTSAPRRIEVRANDGGSRPLPHQCRRSDQNTAAEINQPKQNLIAVNTDAKHIVPVVQAVDVPQPYLPVI